MSTIVTDNKHYSDIANAIRAKNETNTTYKPSEMALAIRAIEGGGIPCTLTVETAAGAEVTATLGNKTVSATANSNGVATLVLKKEGAWTVTATLDGETKSTTVNVYHEIAEEIALITADPILENNTWEQISEIAKSGEAANIWAVGDTKPFVCNGTTYEAQIIGFDHDDVTDSASYGRSKAGITFQFKELTPTEYIFDSSSLLGKDFTSSAMYKTHLPDLQNKLQSELLAVLVGTNKLVAKSSSDTVTMTNQKFTLPAAIEIVGAISSLGAKDKLEGTQYAFYSAGNSYLKKKVGSNSSSTWWTRTLSSMNVRAISTSSSVSSSITNAGSSNALSMAPIFFV